MKVLVLGHNGMLGNCVHRYLSQFHEVSITNLRFPSKEFIYYVTNYKGIIVNCIGAIPQKTKDFSVNTDLPLLLSNLQANIIHPGTDCEDDDTAYGISKKNAVKHILKSVNTKIIKTSVIGRELLTADSLLDWFLKSEGKVDGYVHAMWNGVTTLEWAKHCNDMIYNWNGYNTNTIICSDCISKYELLNIISRVYNKDIEINPIYKGHDKCLRGRYTKSIHEQLQELKEFYG